MLLNATQKDINQQLATANKAFLNATKTDIDQQLTSTYKKVHNALPASKGELEQEQSIINKLVNQVNALTPVRIP